MKKTMLWMSLLIIISLAACSFNLNSPKPNLPGATPTLSGDQTKISQLLTMIPTNTGQPTGANTPSPVLPTVAVQTETPTIAAEGASGLLTVTPKAAAPTSTSTTRPEAATATPDPTATAVAPATATATRTAGPSPTASAGDPRARLGSPTSTDNMDNANTWIWPTGSDGISIAVFSNGKQSIQGLTTKDGWRMANPKGHDFADIYLESTFNVESCHTDTASMADHYGLVVRVPILQEPNQGYLFGFNCNGQYSLRSWNWNGDASRRQDMQMVIDWTTPKDKDVINAGPNKTNVMGIMAVGSRLRLFANGHFLAEYNYSGNSKIPQLSSGYFGAFVGSRTDNQFTAWIDQMSYWENPQP